MELEAAREEEVDIEGLLGFAEYVLSNAVRLWLESRRSNGRDVSGRLSPKGSDGETEELEPP